MVATMVVRMQWIGFIRSCGTAIAAPPQPTALLSLDLPYPIGDVGIGRLAVVVTRASLSLSLWWCPERGPFVFRNFHIFLVGSGRRIVLWCFFGSCWVILEAISEIKALREDFWKNVHVPGVANELNPELEKAGRVADFLELGELFAKDALLREESCGGHFREEFQTEDGEARRDDDGFAYVAAWQYTGNPSEAVMHKEELIFNDIELKTRSYK